MIIKLFPVFVLSLLINSDSGFRANHPETNQAIKPAVL